ncbi:MAG: hypothetical protein CMG69_05345 [Candidatus Marinimicrobia bacterium]|nr:hypothetical protein [Candidatus Neomarinimicrobiota bacterium]|tara:strand:+ start:12229 stop:12723 length:495 start_codon:yes stop_codon:yes gene_type:complete
MKNVIVILFFIFSTFSLGQPEKKDKMDMMIAWKLTEHLKLTSEQSEKFFPRFREHRERMTNLTENERALYKELKENIERGDALSNSDLNKYLKEVSDLKIEKIKNQNSFIDDLEGSLNNVQRAKLIGFEQRFRKEVKDELRHHKKGWGKKERNHFKKKDKQFWK